MTAAMAITGEKFLITGGASLIGSHLTRVLLAAERPRSCSTTT